MKAVRPATVGANGFMGMGLAIAEMDRERLPCPVTKGRTGAALCCLRYGLSGYASRAAVSVHGREFLLEAADIRVS